MLLDVGANADSRTAHLIQYAHMGAAVMEFSHGIHSPRIGLVSIGEEDSKGNQLIIEVNTRPPRQRPQLRRKHRGGVTFPTTSPMSP